MRNVPATVLQQWPAPNYVNPQNQDRGVLVCGAICIAIIVPVVFARIGIRTFIIKSFGVDDWLIIPAAVSDLMPPHQSVTFPILFKRILGLLHVELLQRTYLDEE